MRVFGGDGDPLSNHFKAKFTHKHVEMDCVENGWFYGKGMRNGQKELALQCLEAESGAEAKYLSKGIRTTSNWDLQPFARDLMKGLCKSKFEQVQECKDALHVCWQNRWEIVEVPSSDDSQWGSCLSKEATQHRKRHAWPGNNILGQRVILDKIGNRPTCCFKTI